MRLALTTLVCLLAALALAATARAGALQEATFQDDNHLLYSPRSEVQKTLDTLKSLGVDRVRVTVLWKTVAPEAASRTRPAFDAADPAAYPPGSWDRYDLVLTEAVARGIGVNFNVTGPGPLWAHRSSPRADAADTYEPDPTEFGRFITAAGIRYSGSFGGLPRVNYWSIWNEPNHQGWLTPMWRKGLPRTPVLYRKLFDAAYAALVATGHQRDTILVGETAPAGNDSKGVKRYMRPLTFLRALYCVDRREHRLRGRRARRLGCPRRGGFAAAHPGLMAATGYAHHPYTFLSPRVPPRDPKHVTIGSLSRLTRVLDRIFRVYRSKRRLPLYLTEFGYQTPPDLFGVSFAKQAEYLNVSEYLAYRNRRVATLAQFLLFDDKEPIGLTFQSGLMARNGAQKPSFAAYRLPVYAPRRARRARAFRIWGAVRPAGPGAIAVIERRGRRTWSRMKSVRVSNPRGYFSTKLALRRSATLRVRWDGFVSRAVRVVVRRR